MTRYLCRFAFITYLVNLRRGLSTLSWSGGVVGMLLIVPQTLGVLTLHLYCIVPCIICLVSAGPCFSDCLSTTWLLGSTGRAGGAWTGPRPPSCQANEISSKPGTTELTTCQTRPSYYLYLSKSGRRRLSKWFFQIQWDIQLKWSTRLEIYHIFTPTRAPLFVSSLRVKGFVSKRRTKQHDLQ